MLATPEGWRWIRRGLAVAFFAALAWLLYSRGREMDWPAVWTSLGSYGLATLATGLAFTLIAYLAFGSYDLISRRQVGHRVPVPRTLAIGMVAYALNLNLGALVGGWATRFRLYARCGVEPGVTTRIIGLGILSNWSGYLLVAGVIALLAPPQLPEDWALNPALLPLIGTALLLLLGAYLTLCVLRPGGVLRLRRLEMRIPTLRVAAVQIGASVVHWFSTCMVIFVLLPDSLSFTTVLGVLMMSSIAGAAMHIPAGLGVIEAVFVAALGDRLPLPQILAALLAYRATFYLGPLLLALFAFPFLEWGSRSAALRPGSTAKGRKVPPPAARLVRGVTTR